MQSVDLMGVFAAVVDAGGFSAAGRALGMPTSTVSRAVSRLEEHLDARLLQRTTRRVTTTPTGRAYYERCKQILADIQETEEAVRRMHSEPRGRLRVTAPTASGRTPFVENVLIGFMAAYPGVEVDLTLTNESLDLVGGGYDVALRGGALSDSSLIARKLATVDHHLVAATDYLEAVGRPQSVDDLSEHKCIVYSGRTAPKWPLLSGGKIEIRNPRLAVNSLEFAAAAMLAGQGIALLPLPTVSCDLAAGKVQVVLGDTIGMSSSLHALYPHRRHLSAAVRAFVDFAKVHVAEAMKDERCVT